MPPSPPAHRLPLVRYGVLMAAVLVAAVLLAVLVLPGAAPPACAAAGTTGGATAGETPGSRPAGPATPPLPGPLRVVRAFSGGGAPWAPGHRGVDLAARAGSPVWSAAAGRVVAAHVVVGRPVVSVEHASGWRTTYEPVLPSVAVGQEIRAGQLLGRLAPGHVGCATPCLHWGLRRGRAEYRDPLSLLPRGPARLLPLAPHPRLARHAGRRA